jgi:hypothetical protein
MFTAKDCLERAGEWAGPKRWICFIGMADWESQRDALKEDYVIKRICPIRVEHPGYHRLLRMYFVIERKREKREKAF